MDKNRELQLLYDVLHAVEKLFENMEHGGVDKKEITFAQEDCAELWDAYESWREETQDQH